MKYLQDYMEDRQTKAFEQANAFFAFSRKQLKEGFKKHSEADHFTILGNGLVCNADKAEWLLKELDKIYNDSLQQDIKENTLERIILRELANHEAYFTGDIESTWDAVKNYPGIKKEFVEKLFINKNFKIEENV